MLVYNVVMQGVERFAGNHVAMDIISVEWVRRYEKFLLGEGKSRTTIGIHMRHLRAILNDAYRCASSKRRNIRSVGVAMKYKPERVAKWPSL